MTVTSLAHVPPIERGADRLPAGSVRSHLRGLILNGTLPPGTVLPQVELAERLGVSRTPLREALRMLQEEGLIEAKPHRRARVTGFDPASLDALYATRILLEALGVQLTVPRLTRLDLEEIERCLLELEAAGAAGDLERWTGPHIRFHRLLVMHASDQLKRQIRNQADQGERYRRLYILTSPRAWSVGKAEHSEIVEACRLGQPEKAAVKLARHLGQTALSIMTQLAPEEEPRHVRAALSLVTSGAQISARFRPDR